MLETKEYVIDWDNVNTIDEIKYILMSLEIVFTHTEEAYEKSIINHLLVPKYE